MYLTLTLLVKLTSAPFFISSLTRGRFPRAAALNNFVNPNCRKKS